MLARTLLCATATVHGFSLAHIKMEMAAAEANGKPSMSPGAQMPSTSSVVTMSVAEAEAPTCKPFDDSVTWAPEGSITDDKQMESTWASFAMSPESAVNKARWVLAEPKLGLLDASCLSPSFEFQAPFIGPLDKAGFTGSLANFKLQDAFPDMVENYHMFRADDFEAGRVWWQTRTRATHSGEATKFCGEPTGKKLEFPPQAFSMKFDADGLVEELTVGYVIDKRQGNTGGLGGAFGYFWAVGKPLPFPECQPWKPSKRLRLLGLVGKLARRFKKSEPDYSKASVTGVMDFMVANPKVSFAEKKAFLLEKGVSPVLIAQAACVAPDTDLQL